MSKRELASEHDQDAATGAMKKRKTGHDGGQRLAAHTLKCMANDDYTVGWICAISTEYVAAQAFLDERHDRPKYVSPNDNNDYTLGNIREHNVVIAVLPYGEYGTASAASVAKDMLNSFPNIRIGLMVGIGGGAPSPKHDIRLGDIVVSAPRDGKGGVFQYDFGKTIQNQTFQATRCLNQPPTVLRTAMNGLMAQHETDGNQLEAAIDETLRKRVRLQKNYKRPDPSNDRLYRSAYTHPANDAASCATVCGEEVLNLIIRPERGTDDDNPKIHYGLIASANQLMKDALIRDLLATKSEVLCFEMEAAGLMNDFPCVVIRGICDYSDSHKNKEWQGYAAMAAAAYAKDLLCRIPPNKIAAEKRIVGIIFEVQEGVGRLLSAGHNQEHETILQWLTPVEYAPQQNDYIGRRQAGSGRWLLDSTEFQRWLETEEQILFCPGIPGAGKTILTSVVVEELSTRFQNDTSIGVAYVYCNFRRQDEQKAEDLLASILKQLVQEQSSLPDCIKSLHDNHKKKHTRPSFDELSRTLHAVAAIYSRVFIIVDALDECQEVDGGRAKLLAEIFNLQVKCKAKLFATSRIVPDIEEDFKNCLVVEIRANHEDIWNYLDKNMSQLPDFVSEDINLQMEIKTSIEGAIDGMFLLAQMYLDSLVGKRSPAALRKALKGLRQASNALPNRPSALDDAYHKAMDRIQRQRGDLPRDAILIISWIVFAKRPLKVTELQHALAVESGTSSLDKDNIPTAKHMVQACAPLVTIDEQSNIIRLVHYTTQEYFERTRRWFQNAEAEITTTCATYLSFSGFESGICQNDTELEERLQSNSLYDYASHNWGHHAREASMSIPEVNSFLKTKAQVEASSQALLSAKKWAGEVEYSQNIPKQMTGLHLAAYFGVENAVIFLIDSINSNLKDSYSRTPLSWATENGHEGVVRLLLEQGTELESKDEYGRTLLLWAAKNRHEGVVQLLLEQGAELESKDKYEQTPLSWAAKNRHEGVVRLL